MQFQSPFDARQVEPASFPTPPPLADYHVRIIESEGKATKEGKGGYLELMLEILDPAYMGRKIPYMLNLFNDNPQTCEIAYKQLSAVCHVTGQFNVTDSRQLHNIPFIATIGPQAKNPTYTQVFEVKDLNGNKPGKAGQGTQPLAAVPPTAAAPQPGWAPPANAAWVPPPTQAQPWQQPAPTAAPTQQAWQPPAATTAAPAANVWQPPAAAPQPGAGPAWAPSAAPSGKPPWER